MGRKILKRTVLIFLIGLAINWLSIALNGDLGWSHLRIMAVMQRIALCYGVVSLLALFVNHKYVPHICCGLLIAYAAILLMGNGYAEDGTNIAARIDQALLGYDHLYHKSPVDPEGLLGTIAAIAHTLIGFWCARAMMLSKTTHEKVMRFLLIGAILVICGYLLSEDVRGVVVPLTPAISHDAVSIFQVPLHGPGGWYSRILYDVSVSCLAQSLRFYFQHAAGYSFVLCLGAYCQVCTVCPTLPLVQP